MGCPWRYIWGGLTPADWPPSTGITAPVMYEESGEDSPGDFRCASYPAHRRGQGGQSLRLGAGCLEMVGENRAGRDHVDPDAAVGVVERLVIYVFSQEAGLAPRAIGR